MNSDVYSAISILFEDEYVLVINKPAGMTVNKADTTKADNTVQEWTELYLKIDTSQGSEPILQTDGTYDNRIAFYQRGGIAHRLDKETSGALIVAKDPDTFVELLRQFRERIVKKTYIALAHGKVAPAEGEINVPIGRLPWNRKQFGVVAGGREALTRYKVLSLYLDPGTEKTVTPEYYSLVELYPETGRTHQIRVHLQYIGHPIFADYLYAGRKTQRENRKTLSRVFLHAAKISFLHPRTGAVVLVECPLSTELQNVLNLFVKV